MADNNKLTFLTKKFPELLKNLKGDEKPLWGVMNPQQMIEHMSDSIRIANGKTPMTLHSQEEHVPKMKAFIMSDKEFRPNTKNALLTDIPAPLVNNSIEDARKELNQELSDFIGFFEDDHSKTLMNPFFGELNFEEWVQLLEKHAKHHLKQFSLI